MRPRPVIAGIAAGLVAGGILAASGTGHQHPPAPTVVANAAQQTPPRVRPGHPGRTRDGRYRPGYVQLRVHPGTVRIAAIEADPDGGDRWALRTFIAERVVVNRPSRSLRHADVIGHDRCLQLGRMHRGRFGWVYADGRFHTGRREGNLYTCGSRIHPSRDLHTTRVATTPVAANPRLGVTAVWGQAPGGREVTAPGANARVHRDGVVLLVTAARGGVEPGQIRVDGREHVESDHLPPRFARGLGTIIPGTTRVAARTPDPAGGLPYGVGVASTREGPTCVSATASRIVDNRLGAINRRTGIFTASLDVSLNCRLPNAAIAKKYPCQFGTSGGGTTRNKRPSTALRLSPGRLTVAGSCAADVVSLTLETPRDIRTLTPSRDGHAFVAVYAGAFVTGTLRLTVHRRNGATVHQEFELTQF